MKYKSINTDKGDEFMKIVTLLENRTLSKDLVCNHGLSLYIETQNNKILFDMGTNDNFIKNAEKLGVDLTKVDTAIVSHAHYDHGGGLGAFLAINKTAKVYLSKHAFDKTYVKMLKIFRHYIGIDQDLKNHKQLVWVDDKESISDDLYIFGQVEGNKVMPSGNNRLYKLDGKKLVHDDFIHEINLVIKEDGKNVLISGCSHNGVVNIIENAYKKHNTDIDTVIGGMHMKGLDPSKSEDKSLLDNLTSELSNNKVKNYYTCHCTSEIVYNYMAKHMNNINDIKTGSVFEL